MNRASAATDTRYRILAYLLTAALLISTGLNFYLLRGSTMPGQQEDAADAEELAAVESELLQARRQLARCQRGIAATDTLALQAPTQKAGFISESIVR